MPNTDPTKKWDELGKGKEFLFLIRHPPYY
jgi:hypothetical protein